MGSNSECLLFLKENLHDLRRQGTEWGFSEDTIDRCEEKALDAVLPGQPENFSFEKIKEYCDHIVKKTGPKTRVSIVVLVVVIAAYSGIQWVSYESEYVAEKLRYLEYAFQHYCRILSVPFHRIQKLEEYYHKECILDNPLFTELPPDCDLCKTYKSVKELKMKVPTVKIPLLSYPLMHRGIQTPVRLEDVRELISTHRANLQGEYIISTAKWARFASDLARDDLLEQITQEDKFSCEWDSKERMFLSQIMRRLFPRPSVLPTEMEVALQKHIIIDGKGSKPRILPTSMMGGYCWYAQGTGTRIIVFKPFKQCEDTCKSFQITVKEGDILTYPSDRWLVEATENGDDISVAFVGFMMP